MKEEEKGNQSVKEQMPVSKELKERLLELIIHIRHANEDMHSVWNGGKIIHKGSEHSPAKMRKKIASLLELDELSLEIKSLLKEISTINFFTDDSPDIITKKTNQLEKIVQQL